MEPSSDASFVRDPDLVVLIRSAVEALRRLQDAMAVPLGSADAATRATLEEVATAVAWQIEALEEYLEALGASGTGVARVPVAGAARQSDSHSLHAWRSALDALASAPLIRRLGDHVPGFVASEFFAAYPQTRQPVDGVE